MNEPLVTMAFITGLLGSTFAYANSSAGITTALLIGSNLFVVVLGLDSAVHLFYHLPGV